jgi:hypothetical protein
MNPGALRVLTVVLAVWAISPMRAEAATYVCGGFAPALTSCSTGTRVRAAGLSHDVAGDFNYVGTIESVIAWV